MGTGGTDLQLDPPATTPDRSDGRVPQPAHVFTCAGARLRHRTRAALKKPQPTGHRRRLQPLDRDARAKHTHVMDPSTNRGWEVRALSLVCSMGGITLACRPAGPLSPAPLLDVVRGASRSRLCVEISMEPTRFPAGVTGGSACGSRSQCAAAWRCRSCAFKHSAQ